MYDALIWLLVIEVLGLIAFPLTYTLFRRLPDRGFTFSKILALLLSAYVLWLLGLTHLLPNAQYTIIAILVTLALVSSVILWRKLPEIVSFVRRESLSLLTAELVFLGLFFLWLFLVSKAPAINHTEQPMDFAFLNSILRSEYFPPEDAWLAGHSINYYYFGHFMMAVLTKLTAIPSSISYNLSIALIPALVGAAAFGLVYNLVRLSGAKVMKALLFALAAPLFVVLIGNLEGVLEFVNARGWGSDGFWEWVSIKSHISSAAGLWVLLGLDGVQGSASSFFPKDYLWWWHASRVIDVVVDGRSLDFTITEFPFFSFLVGDLHPHVTALPFLVLNLALGLNLFISHERLGLSWLLRNPWEVFAITLFLGSLAFINFWDFPVFVTILVILVVVKSYGDWGGQVKQAMLSSLSLLVPVLVGAVLLFIPYYFTLDGQAVGILPLRDVMGTRPIYFFLILGPFLILGGSFLLLQLRAVPGLTGKNPGMLATVLVITFLPVLLWAGIKLVLSPFEGGIVDGLGNVGMRIGKLLPGLAIVGVSLYSMLLWVKHGAERPTAFVLLPLAMAMYLLVGSELFYLADVYGTRMNTVFKLYNQVWILLAIVSAYGLYYCSSRPMPSLMGPVERVGRRIRLPLGMLGKTFRYGWVAVVAALVLGTMYYPVAAALDRADDTGGGTLDGLSFLKGRNSGEYDAILWLRDEAPRGRMVEAVEGSGGSYSEYGRISSSTGLPTMLGWKAHEQLWRGRRVAKLLDDTKERVSRIYRSDDPEEVRQLLDTYEIRYVYVGARERREYGHHRFDEFASFLQPVRRFKDVVIYERLQQGKREAIINPN